MNSWTPVNVNKPNAYFTHTVTITIDVSNPDWQKNLPEWVTPAQRAKLARTVARRKQFIADREQLRAKHFIATDAGRVPGESNDCTVRSLATATGLPYEKAHLILAQFGRQKNKGVVFAQFMHEAWRRIIPGLQTFDILMVPYEGLTVEKFLRRNYKGRYIVSVRRHVFAVIDGKAYDTGLSRSRSRIDGLWKIEDSTRIL